MSLIAIITLLSINVLPALAFSFFLLITADQLMKRYDWIGYERTFQGIFLQLRKKTEDAYSANKQLFFKSRIPKIIMNVVCYVLLIIIVLIVKGVLV